MSAIRKSPPAAASRQRGAVLYVALIMLILLAMIGVIGAQVSSIQERMSANYLSANMAFQRAEAQARTNERCLEQMVNRTGAACNAPVDAYCDSTTEPDAYTWATERKLDDDEADKIRLRMIGKCTGDLGVGMGEGPVSEDPNPVFQVTAYQTDRDIDPSSAASIDTIFKP